MRFTMRSATADAAARADSYAAALDMAAWAETRPQPLLGGLAPDMAWRYLKTAASIG